MKTAIILAAGRGERLKPITNSLPKALCQVHGIPLIEHHVINLVGAGFEKIVINHAHLGGQIRNHLGDGAKYGVQISYSPEPPGGLETGGGIYNALPLIGSKHFAAINADIFTDYDYTKLQITLEKDVHLVLVKKPSYKSNGDFSLQQNGLVGNDTHEYTYTGIAIYHTSVFDTFKPGRYSLTPILRHLVHNEKVTGEVYQGNWSDIGTIERLRDANKT